MRRVKSLHPHFTAGALFCISACSAAGLHEQCKQTFGRSEIAREQSTIRIDGCHQSDAPKVMPFGNHLRAHQHIHFTTVHARQLSFQRAFQFGAVGINAHDLHGVTIRPFDIHQQLGQMFFKLLRAAPHGRNVGIATCGARAGHALCEAAVVAAQSAINFVKHPKRTAMRTFTFPTAIGAMQNGGITSSVEQQHALLALGHTLLNSSHQGCRQNSFARLMVHVNTAHKRQLTCTNARRHRQS